MLEAILLAILLSIAFVAVLVAVAVGVFSWQLARSNRVSPTAPSTAPLLWLWSPTQPAKLHRRLRGAVRPLPVARARGRNAPAPPPHVELMQTVASQAVALDQHVVMASRLSRPQRRRHLRALTPQVVEIERLSLRLVHQQRLVGQPANIGGPNPVAPSPAQVLADVNTRLDRLDEAHQELLAIERDSGLLDPDEVLARMANPAPALPQPAPVRSVARPPAGRPQPAPQRRPSPS